MQIAPIRRIGQISYGLYLYHLLGLHVATIAVQAVFNRNLVQAPWLVTLGMLVVSVIIAELSFRYFEQYFLNKRSKVQKMSPIDGKSSSAAR